MDLNDKRNAIEVAMIVYVIQHTHVLADCDEEDVKFIGVYSSEDAANMAIERASIRPGFVDSKDGFSIDKYVVDEDNWTSGYLTT